MHKQNIQDDQALLVIGVAGAALASLLPLYLIVFGAPLSAAGPEAFARIHAAPGFAWRAGLTLVYFPAAVAAHFAFVRLGTRGSSLAVLGFSALLLGNGIDGCYRAMQFLVVHYGWAAQWLQAGDPLLRDLLWRRIESFNSTAPAIQLSYAVCFGCGRLLIGGVALFADSRLVRMAGVLMLLTGLLNFLPWANRLFDEAIFSLPAGTYLWIWLGGLIVLGAALVQGRQASPHPNP